MNKNAPILEAYDRTKELSLKNKDYRGDVLRIFNLLLENDFKGNDLTTGALIRQSNKIKAVIIARQRGTLSGIEEVSFFLRKNNIDVKLFKKDGDAIAPNQKIAEVYGNARRIFSLERICLNVLQRMSGISTETGSLIKKTRNDVKIAGTRKTVLGVLDHKAISVGGGLSHRLGLYDSIIVKSNHLAIIDKNLPIGLFTSLWDAAIKRKKSRFIEIEASYPSRALLAAEYLYHIRKKTKTKIPLIIMLDNFSPWMIWKTLKRMKKEHLKHILIEVSGGISRKNIPKYCVKGVDVISAGYLSHSSPSLNISLAISKKSPKAFN